MSEILSVQQLVDLVFESLTQVRNGEFSYNKSSAIAAAALEAQIKLADALADAEFVAKNTRNLLDLVRAEEATNIRTSVKEGKKPTEAQLEELVNKNSKTIDAKNDSAQAEKEYKKWQYINNTLKDAHIFFRNLDKQQ